MKKFGVIWPGGKGARSPKRQQKAFIEDGVPEHFIGTEDELPRPRDGQMVSVQYLAPLGEDPAGKSMPYPHFVSRLYARLVGDQRVLRVEETGKEYKGLSGLIELIDDWVKHMRRGQTALARKVSTGRPKQDAPSFYLKLSKKEKAALRKEFETASPDRSIALLAEKYGTSKVTLYRAARALGWENPEEFRVTEGR